MKASSYVEMLELELLYSPDIFRLPVIVTSPVSAMAPEEEDVDEIKKN